MTADPLDDVWMLADECAALISERRGRTLSAAAWRRYTTDTDARRAVAPIPGRRDPVTGRPQWRRSVVLDWIGDRPGSNHGAAVRRHRDIARLRAELPDVHVAVIADRLAISLDTVHRHLNGRCTCDV